MQSPQSQQISVRFAEAFASVSTEWGIKKRFFEKYGIVSSNFFRALRNVENNKLDPYWIAALVEEFNISANWILTGRGEMIVPPGKQRSAQ